MVVFGVEITVIGHCYVRAVVHGTIRERPAQFAEDDTRAAGLPWMDEDIVVLGPKNNVWKTILS